MPYFHRKQLRLPHYDYSTPGCYFITICTKDRKCMLSRISVGAGILDGPEITLAEYGWIAEKILLEIEHFYPWLTIDNYVVMPNHVHFLLRITDEGPSRTPAPTAGGNEGPSRTPAPTAGGNEGPSRTPAPTADKVPAFVSTWKRRIRREIGSNIWQRGYYEHIVRDEADFQMIWKYIQDNPAKWTQDRYYMDL